MLQLNKKKDRFRRKKLMVIDESFLQMISDEMDCSTSERLMC